MKQQPSSFAAAAVAAGKPAVATSFRFHRPRGPLCGRGYCGQCEVTIGGRRALACESPPPLTVPVIRDPFRLLGAVAERLPPWFYERRFLRPRVLRGPMLGLLRHLSAAPSLGRTGEWPATRRLDELEVEVAVVGASGAPPGAYTVDREDGALAVGVYPNRTLGVVRDDRLVRVRFERLVLATGSYERLPPVPGNDLPGVLGIAAAERYASDGALPPRTRVSVWASPDQEDRVSALVARHGLDLVWASDVAPERLHGRRRVRAVRDASGSTATDLFVIAVQQPAVELALQAGARAVLSSDGLPIVAASELPPWLELAGGAARRSAGVPDVPPDDDAFACLCEDVRVRDVRACVAQGFAHPELVKRRTGALTGPCQGKLCQPIVLDVLRRAGVQGGPTRARPLAMPVSLGDLAADA